MSFTHTRTLRFGLVAIAAAVIVPVATLGASSWNPTLLVNTESFQVIDEGDGSTDVEIRFGSSLDERIYWDRAASQFRITDDLSVLGTLSGSALRIDGNADVWGNLTASGTLTVEGAATFGGTVNATGNVTTQGRFSGASLRVSGPGEIHGALSASGSVRTDGDLTINDDRTTGADATLTFGNETANQTLKFIHTSQRFEFSKDLKVNGNISGSTLTIDGDVTLRNVTYSFPASQGGANTFLKNDGDGNLSWATTSVGNGSGGIISMHPEFPNAVYFQSGSALVGQLTLAFDSSNKQNHYRWTSSKTDIQDYWIAVRVRVPDNFSSWDPVKPIELRYRTGNASNTVNHVTMRMLDTSDTEVALTGGGALANTSWTTASITGPAGGTFAAKGYFTVLIKVATTSSGSADVGFLNLNWETTTP